MVEAFAKEDVRRSAKAKDLTLNYYEAGPAARPASAATCRC